MTKRPTLAFVVAPPNAGAFTIPVGGVTGALGRIDESPISPKLYLTYFGKLDGSGEDGDTPTFSNLQMLGCQTKSDKSHSILTVHITIKRQ
uniref:Uncharacterized protein n=1 Tax=Glossina palpalis gambiensis TaxID=67801 RepID=A0A1B0C091_9MUSC